MAFDSVREVMWPKQKGADVGPPDVELLKKHLRLEGRLAMEDILLLVRQTKEVRALARGIA